MLRTEKSRAWTLNVVLEGGGGERAEVRAETEKTEISTRIPHFVLKR